MHERRRKVSVVAATVELTCPHCGEPQPSPGGSHLWTIQEALDAQQDPLRDCAACNEPITIAMPNRVGTR